MPESEIERLEEILAVATEALARLDTCIGQSTRLRVRYRLMVREYLLEPRNHLRDRIAALQRRTEEVLPPKGNSAVLS